MPAAAFIAFIEAQKTNIELGEKLKRAVDPAAVVAIAKEAGFEVSAADWLDWRRSLSENGETMELSEEELSGVAAGAKAFPGKFGPLPNIKGF